MSSTGIFAYGSLVAAASASRTLGRELATGPVATLAGWRRRWSQARLNERCEKTFAGADGSIPEWILGLNVEPGEGGAGGPNGVVIAVDKDDLEVLDRRELRYRLEDVSAAVEPFEAATASGLERFERILTYTARPEHHRPDPPPGAVIIAAYASAVEAAFASLGAEQLERFRVTTGPYPVPTIEAHLIRDRIPDGNPRDW